MTGSMKKAPLLPPGFDSLIAQPVMKVFGVTTLRQKSDGRATGAADGVALFGNETTLDIVMVGGIEAGVAVIEAEKLDIVSGTEELDNINVADEVGAEEPKD
jgi:hypothetical protein